MLTGAMENPKRDGGEYDSLWCLLMNLWKRKECERMRWVLEEWSKWFS